jgi:hypothetical protein
VTSSLRSRAITSGGETGRAVAFSGRSVRTSGGETGSEVTFSGRSARTSGFAGTAPATTSFLGWRFRGWPPVLGLAVAVVFASLAGSLSRLGFALALAFAAIPAANVPGVGVRDSDRANAAELETGSSTIACGLGFAVGAASVGRVVSGATSKTRRAATSNLGACQCKPSPCSPPWLSNVSLKSSMWIRSESSSAYVSRMRSRSMPRLWLERPACGDFAGSECAGDVGSFEGLGKVKRARAKLLARRFSHVSMLHVSILTRQAKRSAGGITRRRSTRPNGALLQPSRVASRAPGTKAASLQE